MEHIEFLQLMKHVCICIYYDDFLSSRDIILIALRTNFYTKKEMYLLSKIVYYITLKTKYNWLKSLIKYYL